MCGCRPQVFTSSSSFFNPTVLIFTTFSNRQNSEKMSRIIPLGIYRCSIILPLPVHIIVPCISFFVFLLHFLIVYVHGSWFVTGCVCDIRHLQTSCLVQDCRSCWKKKKKGHTCLKCLAMMETWLTSSTKHLLA